MEPSLDNSTNSQAPTFVAVALSEEKTIIPRILSWEITPSAEQPHLAYHHSTSAADDEKLTPPLPPAPAVGGRPAFQRDLSVANDAHETSLFSAQSGSHSPSYSDIFIDLLFAACLNTYSNAVSLEMFVDVLKFLGYFLALWWAWWTQVYFDVRFRRPWHNLLYLFKSAQRVFRVVVLGFWVAFTATPSEFARGSFTNFTLIYGGSRMVLAADQSLMLLCDLWCWRKGRPPVYLDAANQHYLGSNPGSAQQARATTPKYNIRGICFAHLVSIGTQIGAGLLWILSRYVRHNNEITAPLIVMWIAAVLLEVSGQIANELSNAFVQLSKTVLPERLVLFGLVILGEGFLGIGELLNKISLGSKLDNDSFDARVTSGGWGPNTFLQTGSAVLIIMLLFGGYFHRATNEIDIGSVWVVVWSYIHMLLQMCSALLAVGLKRILAFQNTLQALDNFTVNPGIYMSKTNETLQNVTTDDVISAWVSNNDPFTASGLDAGILAIINVIQSNEGAGIPSYDEAVRLVTAVSSLAGGYNSSLDLLHHAEDLHDDHPVSHQFQKAVVLPFNSFFEFANNVFAPDSIQEWVRKNLFQFKYIFISCAVYLAVDIVIKTMQNRHLRGLTSFRVAMAVRFIFAALLIVLQFAVFRNVSTDAALQGALAVLASILLAELIAQQIVDALRNKLDKPRNKEAKQGGRWKLFGKKKEEVNQQQPMALGSGTAF